MLAHAVDLADVGALADQEIRGGALLLERERRQAAATRATSRRPRSGSSSVSPALSCDASSSSRAPAARLALSGEGWPASTTSMPPHCSPGLQAVTVTRDDHAAHGRAPVRVERGGHRRGGLAGAEHERGPARQISRARAASKRAGAAACDAFSNACVSTERATAASRHRQPPAARCSNVATAGSFLPSRNSRNAPPPVEMYEMRSPTPNCSIAASVSPPPAIENALARRDGFRDAARAGRELGVLEHAERAVPDDRAGALQPLRIQRRGLGADVENHLVARDVARLS